ncbi:MAG: tRNA (adenosine(37)-N6)-dimethylallyltransferase MiaA, partial [Planctomycetes bacterium]|nr:tRNA (adenosine(37)-N6)-dimethylallyltransferase MiaA [Planctomycetota bacterium]
LEVLEQTGRRLSDWQREWGWHGAATPARPLRLVGLSLPEALHATRISARVRAMLEHGWVEEARAIRDGGGFGPTAIQALGYREVLELADGKATRADCEERIVQLTRRFVRRQRTWFRSFAGIRWLDPTQPTARAEARAELVRADETSS